MATAADSMVTVARGAFPMVGLNKIGMLEVTIDIETISAELAAQGDGVLASGDIVQCISLPKGATLLQAGVEVVETVAGCTALTIDLGTDVDDDAWVAAVDVGSSTSYVAGDYCTSGGSRLSEVIGQGAAGAATNTLDITFDTVTGTATAGKLRVWALVADTDALAGN